MRIPESRLGRLLHVGQSPTGIYSTCRFTVLDQFLVPPPVLNPTIRKVDQFQRVPVISATRG
jgi:hypothetical protein